MEPPSLQRTPEEPWLHRTGRRTRLASAEDSQLTLTPGVATEPAAHTGDPELGSPVAKNDVTTQV